MKLEVFAYSTSGELRGYPFILFTEIASWLKYSLVSVFHVFSNICRMWKEQKQTRCCER